MLDSTVEFTIAMIVALLVLGIMAIALQMFLSKADNKRTGLIMPIISFGVSLFASLSMLSHLSTTGTFSGMINGVMVDHVPSTASIIGPTVLIFLLCNVVTGILIAIYATCRGKINRQRGLAMMNAQDLG
jgi:hypothetical protein